ncbi:Telomerase Cajal body protein 1 [Podila epigama]|nr:Telomerase Cajal body protein 1 [Podila epigama]
MTIDSTLIQLNENAAGEDLSHGSVSDLQVYGNTNTFVQEDHEIAETVASENWETQTETETQPQTFQIYDCVFDPSQESHGIVRSFSTGTSFNTTVGESRLRMGIKDDSTKRSNGQENNFFKALKCPDLTTSSPNDTELTPGMVIREGEVIYDMCWYPGMTTLDPATCCVLSSSRDHPVHLWDAFTGELRCSYTIVDHCEVNLAPNALTFNLDGSKPGKDSTKRPTCPTRRSKKGQKGVISCLTFNPDHSNLYAAGSYLKTIGLYDARADELLLLLRDKPLNARKRVKRSQDAALDSKAGPLIIGQDTRRAPMGAVTQVQFSSDGLYLYSASRQDPYIRCWDIRNTAQVLHRLERPGALTNQRISFDLSSDGKWLSTGDMNGDISIFDLSAPADAEMERLKVRIRGHNDVISAATFHPSNSMLATSSGQRKYDLDLSISSSDESDSDMEESISTLTSTPQQVGDVHVHVVTEDSAGNDVESESQIDNSIRLWSIPGEYKWYVDGQLWTGEIYSNSVTEASAIKDITHDALDHDTPMQDNVAAPLE